MVCYFSGDGLTFGPHAYANRKATPGTHKGGRVPAAARHPGSGGMLAVLRPQQNAN